MKPITESDIETFAIEELERLGYQYLHGLAIAPGAEHAERASFEQAVLTGRLRKQLALINLTQDEVAFYNALEINDSAIKVLGDETLRDIAKEIADKVKRNATIDWTIRESARAKLMVLVRRTLSKYGYPPDKQQKAIGTVLKQAELLADSTVKI